MEDEKQPTTTLTLRIPNYILDFVKKKMKEQVFNSLSHGIVRLSHIGIDQMKLEEKIVHSWEAYGIHGDGVKIIEKEPPTKKK